METRQHDGDDRRHRNHDHEYGGDKDDDDKWDRLTSSHVDDSMWEKKAVEAVESWMWTWTRGMMKLVGLGFCCRRLVDGVVRKTE